MVHVLLFQTGTFTPVETTELGEMSRVLTEFERRKTKVMGMCCGTLEEQAAWAADVKALTGSVSSVPWSLTRAGSADLID